MNRKKAFTLMEVLVAMALIAIALPALLQTVAANLRSASSLKETTFAQWVALNVMSELQATKAWPPAGKNNGTETMANADWYWQATVIQTPEKDMRRVIVEVRLNRDAQSPIASLEGYLAKP